MLKAPLDLILVRKIGLPYHRELAAAAVVDGGEAEIVMNDDVMVESGLNQADIKVQARRELAEIERRRQIYLKGRSRIPLENRTLVVVDDGIATGTSIRAAIMALRHKAPERLVLAVPVAPATALAELRPLVDVIVCLSTPTPFGAVGEHYGDFHQLSDSEVVDCLAQLATGSSAERAH